MPGLDVLDLFTLFLAALGVTALLRPPAIWRWLYAPVALILLAANLYERGLHWQIFPALAVLSACALALLFRTQPIAKPAAIEALLGIAASLVLVYLLPEFALPAPTGPYPIGTRTVHWLDPATRRELAVTVWYPAAPAPGATHARYLPLAEAKPIFVYQHWIRSNAFAEAPALPQPFPVLLFGAMWGGRRTQDTFLAEDLASHGYIIVAPDHPGNAARMQLADGSVLPGERAQDLAKAERVGVSAMRQLWADELVLWSADNRFALAHLAGLPWLHPDLDRVGAFGHSFGGSASIALLGTPTNGPEVKAAVNLDGWTLNAIDDRTTQPILVVDAARDASSFDRMTSGPSFEAQLERLDRAGLAQSLTRYGGTRVYVVGTQHADFTDQTLVSPLARLTHTGPLAGGRVRIITRALVLSFFDQTLKHQGTLAHFAEVVPIRAEDGSGPAVAP